MKNEKRNAVRKAVWQSDTFTECHRKRNVFAYQKRTGIAHLQRLWQDRLKAAPHNQKKANRETMANRMDSARSSLHRAHEVRLPGKGCQPEPLRGMVCPGNSVSFFGFVLTIAYNCVIIPVVLLNDITIYHQQSVNPVICHWEITEKPRNRGERELPRDGSNGY